MHGYRRLGVKEALIALSIAALCAVQVEALQERHLTGDAEDVKPKLHGPVYNLSGGGEHVSSAMQWMINRVRGCDDCAVKLDVVVLCSSSPYGYNDFIYGLKGVDSVETLVVKSREEAESEQVKTAIKNAEIVFWGGGDQCKYVRYFKDTEAERAIEYVHSRGGGIGGISAGMAIQGSAVYDACSAGSAQSSQTLLNPYHADVSFTYNMFNWPILLGAITDTHFIERDRMGRLLVFIARQIKDGKYKRVMGIGIDSRTSVVIDKSGAGRVFGQSPVYFVLGDHQPEICLSGVPLTYSNYKVWKISAGEIFNFKNKPKKGYYKISVEKGKIFTNSY